MKKKTVIPQKKRGPPATGKGEPIVVRMHPPQLRALDDWIAQQQQPFPSRPEAVRRLVELGLTVKPTSAPSERQRAAFADLASKAIDSLTREEPDSAGKASRKRSLIKGPEEFREVRVDRPKKKDK